MTDKDAFLKILLTHPHRLGMLVGGLLLAVIHPLLAIGISIGNPYTNNIEDSTILLRAFAGLVWGSATGSCAARAAAAWINGQHKEARNLCKEAGSAQGIIHFSWFLYCIFSNLPTAPHLSQVLSTVSWFWFTNACLQAALGLYLIGVLLPRDSGRTVQITENLRL